MFGALRLLLAVLVVYTHLGFPHGSALGKHAVFGFYALSGFLMTRVLNDVYRFDWKPFAANRVLRLYPMYLTVAAMTAPFLFLLPTPGDFNARYNLPDGWWLWAESLLVLPTYDMPPFRLVPVSWSIAVEMINYVILWAFTARSVRFAWIALAIGIGVHATSFALGQENAARYFPWYGAQLAFALGALVYFYREALRRVVRWPIVVAWVAVLAWAYWLHGMASIYAEIAFYTGLLLFCLVIALFDKIRPARLDQWLGDLAYPAFLTHIFVGLLVNKLVGIPGRTDMLFSISLPLILLMSAALAAMQVSVVEPIRDRVRKIKTLIVRPS